MSIIDIHAHHHPDAYTAALAPLYPNMAARVFGPHPDTDAEDHIQARLALMDAAGVGVQVLSPAATRAPYGLDEQTAVHAARLGNDLNAELVARYPDRFKSFVSLPLPHIEASLRELRRGMDELGMVGVNLHISVLGRSVAEEEFLPIYEEMNRRAGLIFFHPCGNGIWSPMITDYGLTAAVGTSLEDAAIGLHLIGKRIPSRFPEITFVIPHLGGPLPMLLERLDNQFSMRQQNCPNRQVSRRGACTTTRSRMDRRPHFSALGRRSGRTTSCRGATTPPCCRSRRMHARSRGSRKRTSRAPTSNRSCSGRRRRSCGSLIDRPPATERKATRLVPTVFGVLGLLLVVVGSIRLVA